MSSAYFQCLCCEQVYSEDYFYDNFCHDCLTGHYEEYIIRGWFEDQPKKLVLVLDKLSKEREKYKGALHG